MIDLHCHMLPAIDDGAPDIGIALAMARLAVADGIHITACTPHIYPGLYENTKPGIEAAIVALQAQLDAEEIPLQLSIGADTHLTPNLVADLRANLIPTLAGSRYFLLEPPHHVAPPRLEESVFQLMTAGYVPVITHPERLSWIETHYEIFVELSRHGALMQLTSGSLTGRFGRRPKYWSERMLDEGLVDLLATDSHHIDKRPPLLAEGRDAAAQLVGDEEAIHMVETRPRAILADAAPHSMPGKPVPAPLPAKRQSSWRRWLVSLAVGSVFVALSACASGQTMKAHPVASDGATASNSATKTVPISNTMARPDRSIAEGTTSDSADYQVGPQDLLEISVFQVTDLNRTVRVNTSGDISLPLIGVIHVGGRTVQEVEDEIAAKLTQSYLQDPQVSVFVKEFTSQRVTLEGSLRKPGIYPLTGQTTLLQAIAMAEGLSEMADPNGVLVFRVIDGKKQAAAFSLKEIRKGNAEDPLIYGDDIVVVEESGRKSAFSRLIKAMPLLGVFTIF